MSRKIDTSFIKQEVFNLDNNTQLEFINRKTIVVIDKERFLVCKQFMLEDASDEDYARYLNIPLEKVRFFKHKMQIFENSIRARRRQARLNAQRKKKSQDIVRKREISSEERFRRARELIGKNYSTNQISKILKVSERSVTRFKRRMRDEKKRLKAEGKIRADPDDPDDHSSFKYLSAKEKINKAKVLFRKRLSFHEISEILKISERSVRRWKDRLDKMESEPEVYEKMIETKEMKKLDFQKTDDDRAKRKRRAYLDKEKVQYARELIENGLSNKEMSMLLEMSIACVRKLKMKILNGTADELIDDSEEHYLKINLNDDNANDPLNFIEDSSCIPLVPSGSQKNPAERKPKVILRDREMYMVTLLRENGIRTMDIAKMMEISERSVTRLLSKSRELDILEYSSDVVEEVQRLIAAKDQILNSIVIREEESEPNEPVSQTPADDSKMKIAINLLAMNVKPKDVCKMLDVPEKTVQKWKLQMIKEEVRDEILLPETIQAKEEIIVEEYLE